MDFLFNLSAKTVIKVTGGKAALVKGKLSMAGVRDIQELVDDRGIKRGSIRIDKANKISCSGNFQSSDQQRVRNVLSQYL